MSVEKEQDALGNRDMKERRAKRPYSYPRLTLDFHTNKRIIDEVVRVARLPCSSP